SPPLGASHIIATLTIAPSLSSSPPKGPTPSRAPCKMPLWEEEDEIEKEDPNLNPTKDAEIQATKLDFHA
ncbi:hypothetical protein HAX54_006652, partial [Datura stramonium]|nr:hypothetical protein [Datura stramonium]